MFLVRILKKKKKSRGTNYTSNILILFTFCRVKFSESNSIYFSAITVLLRVTDKMDSI